MGWSISAPRRCFGGIASYTDDPSVAASAAAPQYHAVLSRRRVMGSRKIHALGSRPLTLETKGEWTLEANCAARQYAPIRGWSGHG